MRLADQYDGFLVDLDGVVWLGHEMLPGAVETLGELSASGKPVAFVTNSPRLSPAEHADVLRGNGIEVEDGRVVTAGSTLIAMALERFGPRPKAIATGTDSFLSQLDTAGIVLLDHSDWEQAEAVLVSGHVGFHYGELKATSMAARAGALLAATGRDPTMPMPDGHWPGTGSILTAIETASGKTGVVAGKPEARIFEAGLEAIGAARDSSGRVCSATGAPMRVAMLGDRADTDVAGAQAVGIDGILVGDGEDPAIEPDHVIPDLAGLIRPLD
jgi:glycerol 3-phosphatase-2